LLTTPTPLTANLHIPTARRIIVPVRLRTCAIVVALALVTASTAPAANATGPTREEEKLLLVVGKEVLRVYRGQWEPRCLWYWKDKTSDPQPPSLWLLNELRHDEPRLRICNQVNADDALMLGPIRWSKPQKAAAVFYTLPIVNHWFNASRDFRGRWHLSNQTVE